MRCTVCGKDDRFHKQAQFALQQHNKETGKWETLSWANTAKCVAIQRWQDALLNGTMSGRNMRIQKLGPVVANA